MSKPTDSRMVEIRSKAIGTASSRMPLIPGPCAHSVDSTTGRVTHDEPERWRSAGGIWTSCSGSTREPTEALSRQQRKMVVKSGTATLVPRCEPKAPCQTPILMPCQTNAPASSRNGHKSTESSRSFNTTEPGYQCQHWQKHGGATASLLSIWVTWALCHVPRS